MKYSEVKTETGYMLEAISIKIENHMFDYNFHGKGDCKEELNRICEYIYTGLVKKE